MRRKLKFQPEQFIDGCFHQNEQVLVTSGAAKPRRAIVVDADFDAVKDEMPLAVALQAVRYTVYFPDEKVTVQNHPAYLMRRAS